MASLTIKYFRKYDFSIIPFVANYQELYMIMSYEDNFHPNFKSFNFILKSSKEKNKYQNIISRPVKHEPSAGIK